MDSAWVLAAAHVLCRARLLCTRLLLRVRAVSLAVLVVLRLAVWRRRRVLLLLIVAAAAAAVALLLLVCAVISLAVALAAAVVVVARHGEYVCGRDVWGGRCRCYQGGKRAQLPRAMLMSVAGEGRQGVRVQVVGSALGLQHHTRL